jgi:hypothetical protein
VQVGNTPVLILGENSIALMEDVKEQKRVYFFALFYAFLRNKFSNWWMNGRRSSASCSVQSLSSVKSFGYLVGDDSRYWHRKSYLQVFLSM